MLFRISMTLVFLVMIMTPSPAVSQQAALSEGQTAQYQVTGDADLTENVTRSELTVTRIEGTVITINDTDVYLDGSSSSEILWLDLGTGQSNATVQGYYFAILPGLSVGDPIYPGSSVVVQGNESRRYGGSSRQVNFYNFTEESGSTAYYWDRDTGIYTEIVRRAAGLSFHVNMTLTNIWNPDQQTPEASYLLPILFGVAIVTALIVVYFLRPGRRSREKTH